MGNHLNQCLDMKLGWLHRNTPSYLITHTREHNSRHLLVVNCSMRASKGWSTSQNIKTQAHLHTREDPIKWHYRSFCKHLPPQASLCSTALSDDPIVLQPTIWLLLPDFKRETNLPLLKTGSTSLEQVQAELNTPFQARKYWISLIWSL